jgi:hypothetical protein
MLITYQQWAYVTCYDGELSCYITIEFCEDIYIRPRYAKLLYNFYKYNMPEVYMPVNAHN